MNEGTMVSLVITLIYFVLTAFLALIPAFISKKKGRSFLVFYIFGLFFFVGALIVSVALGDVKNEEKVSGKGLWLVILIGSACLIFKPVFTKLEELSSVYVTPRLGDDPSAGLIAALAVIELLIAILIALIIAMIIADLIQAPIMALTANYNENARRLDSKKPAKSAAKRIFKGLLVGSAVFFIIRKIQIDSNIKAYDDSHSEDETEDASEE